jgi:hypothetical protein
LARLHHLVVRLGLHPGRRLTTPWLLRFIFASVLTMLLWGGVLWTLSLVAGWASAH